MSRDASPQRNWTSSLLNISRLEARCNRYKHTAHELCWLVCTVLSIFRRFCEWSVDTVTHAWFASLGVETVVSKFVLGPTVLVSCKNTFRHLWDDFFWRGWEWNLCTAVKTQTQLTCLSCHKLKHNCRSRLCDYACRKAALERFQQQRLSFGDERLKTANSPQKPPPNNLRGPCNHVAPVFYRAVTEWGDDVLPISEEEAMVIVNHQSTGDVCTLMMCLQDKGTVRREEKSTDEHPGFIGRHLAGSLCDFVAD